MIYSYYTMNQSTRDGCGMGALTRWPSQEEIQEGGREYSYTWLHRGGTFLHTNWRHPYNLFRIEQKDNQIEYYLIAETEFGQGVAGGPWHTTVTLKTMNEEAVERLEEIYFIRHPWLSQDSGSSVSN